MSYKVLVTNSRGYNRYLYLNQYSLPHNTDDSKLYDYQVWVEFKDNSKDNYWICNTPVRDMNMLANSVTNRYEYGSISKIHFNLT